MRLAGVGATLHFEAKVRLLARLDDLKQVHTTALVLTEAQSNPILDLASTVGLYSVVELEVAPEAITHRRQLAETTARIAHTVSIFNGRPGLFGFLINCPISQD